jgi:hypothetical protein
MFDLGLIPFIGVTSFSTWVQKFSGDQVRTTPPSYFQQCLSCSFLTRPVYREGFQDEFDSTLTEAQNFAPETNGFEAANRNQFWNVLGRKMTNDLVWSIAWTTGRGYFAIVHDVPNVDHGKQRS